MKGLGGGGGWEGLPSKSQALLGLGLISGAMTEKWRSLFF